MKNVDLQPAYILHRRQYTDSKIILDLFTPDYGRISGVIRSGNRKQGRLHQPFVNSLVSWIGRSELKTLTHYETVGIPLVLNGKYLYSAMYLNELLLRACPVGDPHQALYEAYVDCLDMLGHQTAEGENCLAGIDPILRGFEFKLITELGYGLSFDVDILNGADIQKDSLYEYAHGEGFREVSLGASESIGVSPRTPADRLLAFIPGANLLAIAIGDYSDPLSLKVAKQITRRAIREIIGEKPLKSRELFVT